MDFGALPPEINSARIYSGPGSRPLMQAAAAWQRLANELTATAASYSSVISGLTGDDWLGPSALSMAAARPLCRVDEGHRRLGRAGRGSGRGRGERLRVGVRGDRAPDGNRGQPPHNAVTGQDQCFWPEHPGDRD